MTIEELASQAGTATTTVRMYQSKGLLPPPERRGRIGYYGHGHLARLRLIAQLQEQGFSLASIKQLTDAWESGRGLDDILGLETQVAAVWAPEPPARLKLGEFKELFAGQPITPAIIKRADPHGAGRLRWHLGHGEKPETAGDRPRTGPCGHPGEGDDG